MDETNEGIESEKEETKEEAEEEEQELCSEEEGKTNESESDDKNAERRGHSRNETVAEKGKGKKKEKEEKDASEYSNRRSEKKKMTLHVSNIRETVTDSELKEIFTRCGSLKDCRIINNPITKESRGFGFVTFFDEDSCQRALKELQDYSVRGQRIRLERARRSEPYDPTPGHYRGPPGTSIKYDKRGRLRPGFMPYYDCPPPKRTRYPEDTSYSSRRYSRSRSRSRSRSLPPPSSIRIYGVGEGSRRAVIPQPIHHSSRFMSGSYNRSNVRDRSRSPPSHRSPPPLRRSPPARSPVSQHSRHTRGVPPRSRHLRPSRSPPYVLSSSGIGRRREGSPHDLTDKRYAEHLSDRYSGAPHSRGGDDERYHRHTRPAAAASLVPPSHSPASRYHRYNNESDNHRNGSAYSRKAASSTHPHSTSAAGGRESSYISSHTVQDSRHKLDRRGGKYSSNHNGYGWGGK